MSPQSTDDYFEIPESEEELINETPEKWPDAPDVFATVAPTAARDAKSRYDDGLRIEDAAVFAADSVIDEWCGYTGDTRQDAVEALEIWILYEVCDENLPPATKFQFNQPRQRPHPTSLTQ